MDFIFICLKFPSLKFIKELNIKKDSFEIQ